MVTTSSWPQFVPCAGAFFWAGFSFARNSPGDKHLGWRPYFFSGSGWNGAFGYNRAMIIFLFSLDHGATAMVEIPPALIIWVR
jgi:hypothetical protein